MKNNQEKSKRGGKRPGAGRPKGVQNKATRPLKEAAREYTEAALNTLVSVMAGGDGVTATAQVQAAREILDRGYGKASQVIAGDEDGGPIKITRIELVPLTSAE